MTQELQKTIDAAWDDRASINPTSAKADIRDAVLETIERLDSGKLRVAEKKNGKWVTNEWAKKAVLLSFRLEDNDVMEDGYTRYYDKVPS
jgi:2,3,4,5-tetrahydropyridine-2,6-dicarboxylate N-succinyltransferase